jgi:ribosomal protein S18 acetylase RimI-like enzyme
MLVSMRRVIGPGCWHVGDLAWRFFLHSRTYDLAQTVRLWSDRSGDLLGFAIYCPPAADGTVYFEMQVHPRARGQGLEEEMLDWLTAVGGQRLVAEPGVFGDDMAQISALERRGFQRTGAQGLLLLHPLGEPLPEPSLPPGWELRPLAGRHEAAARAAAQREAFGSTLTTEAQYLRLMALPGYQPDLDLVAIAPSPSGGTVAAFCLGWLDGVNRVGLFEPVGTRPAYRRLGLARALLLAGLRRLALEGAGEVIVGPIPGGDEAALHLYRSVGFGQVLPILGYAL